MADFAPDHPILLVKPSFGISAAWAYRHVATSRENPSFPYAPQLLGQSALCNDLERPVFEKFPVLGGLKSWLLQQDGVRAALLSGSGSTTLAVLHEDADSDALVARLAARYGEHTWIHLCRTLPVPG